MFHARAGGGDQLGGPALRECPTPAAAGRGAAGSWSCDGGHTQVIREQLCRFQTALGSRGRKHKSTHFRFRVGQRKGNEVTVTLGLEIEAPSASRERRGLTGRRRAACPAVLPAPRARPSCPAGAALTVPYSGRCAPFTADSQRARPGRRSCPGEDEPFLGASVS